MGAPSSQGAAAPEEAATTRVRRRRLFGLLLAVSALVTGYAILFSDFHHRSPAIENVFEAPLSGAKPPLDIYLEVLSVDPVKQALLVRLDFGAKSEPGGLRHPGAPATDMVVEVSDGIDVQDVELRAGQAGVSKTLPLYVRGALEDYPVDRYVGSLRIRAVEGKQAAGGAAVPVRLTTWEEIAGWEVAMTKGDPAGSENGGLSLTVLAQRPSAHVFFAFVLFAAMILIAASALAIGGLAFLGVRRVEATLVSALGAMVFAVPALRNVLPGAPPLGVRADAFVFLWVQMAVILGLTLFVATWARRGSGP
ncbi:MAG: DUF4436 family protein [Methylocella sp.]